ncbi:hypothetical protein [Nocardioides sp. B-3]|uniref:hypothetical protein n=1 Tax=Nocardioides sp. B-3 TaxID=2895565 RepID=UPI003FA59729
MVASGCGGTGRELAAYADLVGLDFVTRSITLDPRPGGSSPRVVETPSGPVNAIGLQNPGLEHFPATELPWLVRAGVRVFVSIAGSTMGEYADLARRLSRAPGVAGLEINVGAPRPGWARTCSTCASPTTRPASWGRSAASSPATCRCSRSCDPTCRASWRVRAGWSTRAPRPS